MFWGCMFAWASIAIADCSIICWLVKVLTSDAMSTS